MHYLDLTLPTPAENLAADEALLDWHEAQGGPGTLRFWEPADYFVVLGYGNRMATEADVAASERLSIPIFRRCSGGGAVLQGPGCLNYALILRIEPGGSLDSISAANRFIMERHRAAVASLFPGPPAVTISGHTDLAVADRKFSGNSQRRRKQFLLFHGSFLLRFDLDRIEQFLPPPSRQPDYRRGRAHRDFLMNLPVASGAVKAALRQAWSANDATDLVPRETILSLVRDKYVTNGWNQKF